MRNLLVGACLLAAIGYFGSKFYLHDKVSRNLDTVLTAARPYVDVEYEGVSSTLSGELSVDGITAHVTGYKDPIQIDSVSIVTPGYFDLLKLFNTGSRSGQDFEIPDSLAIAFRGVSVDVNADFMEAVSAARQAQFNAKQIADPLAECVGTYGFTADMLKQLGYSKLVVDTAVGYRQENNRLVFDMSTNIENMYDLSFVMTLDRMPSPQSIAMGGYQPRLVDGRFEYIDRSLEERVMKLCSAESEIPAETVIAARVEALQTMAGASGIQFDDYVIDPYIEFLKGKDRFVVTAKPIEPVDLTQLGLYKPGDVPALLNLSAEAF